MRPAPFLLLLATTLAMSPSLATATPQPITFAERELFDSPGDNMITGNLDESPLPELVGVRGGDVLIRRNLGGRMFAESIVVPMASGTIVGPVLADLDGDGRLDLVAWQKAPAALFVRMNLGGLTFSATTTYALPSVPTGICAGDLNGDARSDIVVLRLDGFTALLAGPGGALSGATPQSIVPGELYSPQIADLNGDGTGDLAVFISRYNDYTIEWFSGNGDGTFGPADTVATTGNTFVVADLDQDGDMDIVQSKAGWNLNDGAGHFAATVWVSPYIACAEMPSIRVGDLDEDGTMDIVLATPCGGSAQQNHFVIVAYDAMDSSSRHIARWHVPKSPWGVELVDLDGDLHLDVATHCYGSSDYFVQSSGEGDRSVAMIAYGDHPTAILWSDGHGALLGKLDIPLDIPDDIRNGSNYAARGLLALRPGAGAAPDLLGAMQGDMLLLRNRGRRDFYAPESIGRGTPCAATDLNGDGADDLLLTTSDSIWVRLRIPTTADFGAATLLSTGLKFVGLADFDGDGRHDLVLEDQANAIWARHGTGSGDFATAGVLFGTLPPFHGQVLMDDLNNDGRADVATAEAQQVIVGTFEDRVFKSVLHVLLNDGSGAMASDITDTLTAFMEYAYALQSVLAGGDVDGDGDRDIVMEKQGSDGSHFGAFLNDGTGAFDVAGPARYSGTPGGLIACSDLNGDGLSDLLLHDSDGYDLDFHALEAIGGGQFGEWRYLVGVDDAYGMVAADFDRDGRPDVALLDAYEGRVAVMFNSTPFGPTPTQLSLGSARVVDDAIQLEWIAPGPEVYSAQLERSDGAAWITLATLTSDGLGQIRYRDADVARGSRYGYRLRYRDGARELLTAESWVDMPKIAFALRAPLPSPVHGVPAFGVSLPARGDAALEILDIAGRRVREQRLSGLAPGDHRVTLEGAPLSPGLYFARLRLAEASARVRFVVIR